MPRLDIENYVFLVVLYILCFVYFFKVNTEYLCSILLIILNVFYLLLFLSDIEGNSNINLFIFTPVEIPLKLIILFFWLLLIASNSWFINTLEKVHRKFSNSEKGSNFGSEENYKIKDYIKILLVCGTILLLLIHLISLQVAQSYIPKSIRMNSVKLLVIVIGLVSTSISIYMNDKLSSNTNIITQQ
jgi:hypothetical protein